MNVDFQKRSTAVIRCSSPCCQCDFGQDSPTPPRGRLGRSVVARNPVPCFGSHRFPGAYKGSSSPPSPPSPARLRLNTTRRTVVIVTQACTCSQRTQRSCCWQQTACSKPTSGIVQWKHCFVVVDLSASLQTSSRTPPQLKLPDDDPDKEGCDHR